MAPRSKTLKIGKETTVVPLNPDGKARVVGETESFVLVTEEQNEQGETVIHQINPALDPECKYMLYFSVSYTQETQRYMVVASMDVKREQEYISGAFIHPTASVADELIRIIKSAYMNDVALTTEGWHAFVFRMNPADIKTCIRLIYPDRYNPAKHLSDCIVPLNMPKV